MYEQVLPEAGSGCVGPSEPEQLSQGHEVGACLPRHIQEATRGAQWIMPKEHPRAARRGQREPEGTGGQSEVGSQRAQAVRFSQQP